MPSSDSTVPRDFALRQSGPVLPELWRGRTRRAEAVVLHRRMRGRAAPQVGAPAFTEGYGYESAAQMAGPTRSGLS